MWNVNIILYYQIFPTNFSVLSAWSNLTLLLSNQLNLAYHVKIRTKILNAKE